LTQSPELGAWALCFLCRMFFYAAAGRAKRLLLRNGSYTSPLTHKRCSNTANLRAVAMMARFLPFLPPRECSQAGDVVRHSAIVARFAERLARTNPRFNAQRFEDVCSGRRVR
jgi:hypothetical protein